MKNVRFIELLSNIVDNRGKTCPTAETGIPLIATNCVKNTALYPTFERVRYVSDETYRTWFRGHPMAGDILFVNKGSPGEVCLVPDPVSFCIAQDMVAIRANPDVIYPPYLFAALRSDTVQSDIGNMHVGTMIPHFKKGDFDKLFIPLPDDGSQRFIGDVYMELSKKIDLNRRMNETLEAMARALFRDWFVDFGPTRAKMAGEAPYLSPDLWSLFPDRLDDTGKPEGWEISTVGDVGEVICGKTPPTSGRHYYGGEIPFITIPDMHGNIFILETSKTLSRAGSETQVKKLLLPNSICVSCIATPGLVAVTTQASHTNQQINSVVPSELGEMLYWYWALRDLGPAIRSGGSGGSVLANLSTGRFSALPILHANSSIRVAFHNVVSPYFERVKSNQYESRTLAQTRDLLLPRLMSGELRVAGAARTVEVVL